MTIDCPEHFSDLVHKKTLASPMSDSLKKSAIDFCAGCSCETESILKFDEFSKINRLAGDNATVDDTAHLGRVIALSEAARFLEDGFEYSSGAPRYTQAKILKYFATIQNRTGYTKDEVFEANGFLEDLDQYSENFPNNFRLSGDVCWLFQTGDEPLNDFKGKCGECLPFRLGLPSIRYDPTDYIKIEYLGLIIPKKNLPLLKLSTSLDSDYENVASIWEPYGVTKLLDPCPTACKSFGGLTEYVCPPPSYHQRNGHPYVFKA